MAQNVTIQENDQDEQESNCDVNDSQDAAVVDSDDDYGQRQNNGGRI